MPKNTQRILLILFSVGVACAVIFWKDISKLWEQRYSEVAQTAPQQEALQTPAAKPSPSASNHFPVPGESSATESDDSSKETVSKKLPSLEDSDPSIQEALLGLFGKGFESLFNLNDFIRRVVVTLDKSTGQHPVPTDASPLVAVEGQFSPKPSNAKRYAPYMNLLKSVDSKKFVEVYVHFYPLFQTAYHDINPHGYFNDRLVEVIDNLIDTPEVKGPAKLILKNVSYKYADPQLEDCTAGQKLLLRIGPENAGIFKTKLKEIREMVTHLGKSSHTD